MHKVKVQQIQMHDCLSIIPIGSLGAVTYLQLLLWCIPGDKRHKNDHHIDSTITKRSSY